MKLQTALQQLQLQPCVTFLFATVLIDLRVMPRTDYFRYFFRTRVGLLDEILQKTASSKKT